MQENNPGSLNSRLLSPGAQNPTSEAWNMVLLFRNMVLLFRSRAAENCLPGRGSQKTRNRVTPQRKRKAEGR